MIFNDRIHDEWWLAKRLRAHGAHVFSGDTTSEQRKQLMRAAIHAVGPSVVAGRNSEGKTKTYEECFEAIYSEPLGPAPTACEADRGDPSEQSAPAEQG